MGVTKKKDLKGGFRFFIFKFGGGKSESVTAGATRSN